MFLLVRPIQGPSLAISGEFTTTRDLLHAAAARRGITHPTALNSLGLEFAGKQLDLDASLGMPEGSTVNMTCRMQGGKPVQVRLLTPSAAGGSNVTVDIEDDTPMYEVKLQLQELTGVPVADQRVMLQGIGQVVMGDKRKNIGFTHSGSTGSFYLGLLGTGTEK